jgi:hypothetical protein
VNSCRYNLLVEQNRIVRSASTCFRLDNDFAIIAFNLSTDIRSVSFSVTMLFFHEDDTIRDLFPLLHRHVISRASVYDTVVSETTIARSWPPSIKGGAISRRHYPHYGSTITFLVIATQWVVFISTLPITSIATTCSCKDTCDNTGSPE